jgi:hypothetical protein
MEHEFYHTWVKTFRYVRRNKWRKITINCLKISKSQVEFLLKVIHFLNKKLMSIMCSLSEQKLYKQ